jgi:hypothetical protein
MAAKKDGVGSRLSFCGVKISLQSPKGENTCITKYTWWIACPASGCVGDEPTLVRDRGDSRSSHRSYAVSGGVCLTAHGE